MINIAYTLFFTLTLVLVVNAQIAVFRHMIDSNEDQIIESLGRRCKELQYCQNNSICAQLQKNKIGINILEICECKTGQCPLFWNSNDGHTITQGKDQFKYCEQPPAALSVCNSTQSAVSSRFHFYRGDGEIMAWISHIHCICPKNYGYKNIVSTIDHYKQHWETVLYSPCKKLNKCAEDDVCRLGWMTSGQYYFEDKDCDCPKDQTCPSSPDLSTEQYEKNGYTYYKFYCIEK
uniref:SLPTX11 n=1 Tax=Hemiscolopendra marginata TaxID=943146 RepID=A0A646QDL6_9MYRI